MEPFEEGIGNTWSAKRPRPTAYEPCGDIIVHHRVDTHISTRRIYTHIIDQRRHAYTYDTVFESKTVLISGQLL